jgi:formylglycine-generating enzyme required for sulfatase activity
MKLQELQINKTQSGSFRVLHGGSWNVSAQFSRAEFRNFNSPVFRIRFFGFRLVLGENYETCGNSDQV